MTDGILLAELQHDRDLRRYDTIVIDEAHERSLNIDFILGYLKRLLPRRPDLKVVITSATIDPQRFADHFASRAAAGPGHRGVGSHLPRRGPLPPARRRRRVRGRRRGRPRRRSAGRGPRPDHRHRRRRQRAVDRAARRGHPRLPRRASGRSATPPTRCAGLDLPQTEVLPLFGRLSAAEQHRVFGRRPPGSPPRRARHQRRRDLADRPRHPLRRRHRHRPHLPVVRADQGAAAADRADRARPAPTSARAAAAASPTASASGSTPRTTSLSRPEFTDPEILRTNLASVILQMTSLGLGDVADFPFVDPPDPRAVTDGVRLLEELRAVEPETRAAARSRRFVRAEATADVVRTHPRRLPVDPRLARMVIEADAPRLPARGARHRRGAVAPGPARAPAGEARARRRGARSGSRRRHVRLPAPTSTCGATCASSRRRCPCSAFRRMCKAEYLHYLRVREWQDLHAQLRQACKQAGSTPRAARPRPTPSPTSSAVHRSLLAGLLSHDRCPGRGPARLPRRPRRRFAIAPGSVAVPQAAAPASWRRAGRDDAGSGPAGCARIDPVWAEAGGRAPGQAHLLRAALVGAPRQRAWPPSGSPCTACRSSPAARRLRRGRPRGGAASCSSGTRSSRGTGTPSTGSVHDNRRRSSSGCASSRPGPGGATSSSTTRRSRLLRRADPGRGRLRPALRHAGGRPRRGASRGCCTSPRTCSCATSAEAVDRDDYPTTWVQGDLALAGDLPVRARHAPTTA